MNERLVAVSFAGRPTGPISGWLGLAGCGEKGYIAGK